MRKYGTLNPIKIAVGVGLPLVILSLTQSHSIYALAQSVDVRMPAPAQNQAVLTVKLRDSISNPLSGVRCEVLSYDWGLVPGQPFSVIARGDTDKTGIVTFDVTAWPNSGYRFKFSKTPATRPADTFFEDENKNQYRGYPGATVGGRSETQKFVLAGDGLAYNDTSKEGQSPNYAKNPVGGLQYSRVTIMPSEDFLATVKAATITAQAQGQPSPTRPPRPAFTPAPGFIQPALNQMESSLAPTATQATLKGEDKGRGVVEQSGPVNTSAASINDSNANTASPNNVNQVKPAAEGNLIGSLLLALAGLSCLALFYKFRARIYPLLGIKTPSIQSLSQPKGKGTTTSNLTESSSSSGTIDSDASR